MSLVRLCGGVRALLCIGLLTVTLFAWTPPPAGADGGSKLMPIVRFLGLGVGGYFFTSSSADNFIGGPKFYGDSHYYVKPKHFHSFDLDGGVELLGATDHWQPFSGGNTFSLDGGSVRVSRKSPDGKFTPYITAGVF